jgi:predicted RecA/RadA family phage recombinase
MEAYFLCEGNSLDYTPVSDVDAGTVLFVGGKAGIALTDIEADRLGAVQVRGIVRATKASATVFGEGSGVQWDDTNKVCVTSGDFAMGTAPYGGASGVTTVDVYLN